MGLKLGSSAPFLGDGELGPHLTKCRLVEAYLNSQWHLDLPTRLGTTDMGRKLGAVLPFWEES